MPTGQRVYSQDLDADETTWYMHDGHDVVTDYLQEGTGKLDLSVSYINALGLDDRIGRVTASGGATHFYVGDLVGTTAHLLTSSETLVNSEVRDAWGNSVASSLSVSDRYDFAGRESDSESGLTYMRHRLYDPRTGRFGQKDPLVGNRPSQHYLYSFNQPTRFIDPMGLEGFWPRFKRGIVRTVDFILDVIALLDEVWDITHGCGGPDVVAPRLYPYSWNDVRHFVQDQLRPMITELGTFYRHETEVAGTPPIEAGLRTASYGVAKVSGVENIRNAIEGDDLGASLVQARQVSLTPAQRLGEGVVGGVSLVSAAVAVKGLPSALMVGKGTANGVRTVGDKTRSPSSPGVAPGQGDKGWANLLGRNPRGGRHRWNTNLPGGRPVAKSIFRQLAKGRTVTFEVQPNGTVRQYTSDNFVQIRYNLDGSTRVDINHGGTLGRETIHFDP